MRRALFWAPLLSRGEFAAWAELYLDTDPDSRTLTPPSVRIPTGPSVEILRTWHGELPYDPSLVRDPVCLVRGEWDGRLRAVRVIRDYGMFDRRETPQYYPDVRWTG